MASRFMCDEEVIGPVTASGVKDDVYWRYEPEASRHVLKTLYACASVLSHKKPLKCAHDIPTTIYRKFAEIMHYALVPRWNNVMVDYGYPYHIFVSHHTGICFRYYPVCKGVRHDTMDWGYMIAELIRAWKDVVLPTSQEVLTLYAALKEFLPWNFVLWDTGDKTRCTPHPIIRYIQGDYKSMKFVVHGLGVDLDRLSINCFDNVFPL
jgi:hypothetical protein